MKKALLYLFWFILVQFLVTWVVYAVWMMSSGDSAAGVLRAFLSGSMQSATGGMLITASAVYCVAAVALFIWRKWAQVSPAYIRTRQWGVFFWCAVASVGTLVPSAYLQELLPGLSNLSEAMFRQIMDNDYGYFVLCLLVPFTEELVFRGAIQRALHGAFTNHWAAIAISAVIFSVAHFNPAQMPHAFLIGLLLGWMYYRTGSILPGVLLHWVNNTVIYAVYVLMPTVSGMSLADLFGGSAYRVIMSVVFSLFIFVPAVYQLNARMKRAV